MPHVIATDRNKPRARSIGVRADEFSRARSTSLVQPLDVIITIARLLVDSCGTARPREVSGPSHPFPTAAGSHDAFIIPKTSRARTAQSTVCPRSSRESQLFAIIVRTVLHAARHTNATCFPLPKPNKSRCAYTPKHTRVCAHARARRSKRATSSAARAKRSRGRARRGAR